jgi:hypothetical protein
MTEEGIEHVDLRGLRNDLTATPLPTYDKSVITPVWRISAYINRHTGYNHVWIIDSSIMILMEARVVILIFYFLINIFIWFYKFSFMKLIIIFQYSFIYLILIFSLFYKFSWIKLINYMRTNCNSFLKLIC